MACSLRRRSASARLGAALVWFVNIVKLLLRDVELHHHADSIVSRIPEITVSVFPGVGFASASVARWSGG